MPILNHDVEYFLGTADLFGAGIAPAGHSNGTRLFNLANDQTESTDLSGSAEHAALFKNMSTQLAAFKASIVHSAVHESQCQASPDHTTPAAQARRERAQGIQPACTHVLKEWPGHGSTGGKFELRTGASGAQQCLTASQTAERASVAVRPCAAGTDSLQAWELGTSGKLALGVTVALCVKPDYSGREDECAAGHRFGWARTVRI